MVAVNYWIQKAKVYFDRSQMHDHKIAYERLIWYCLLKWTEKVNQHKP